MKSQYWCDGCGYFWVNDSDKDIPEKCPVCESKKVEYEMTVVNDRVFVSKEAHGVNRYV